MIKLHLNSNKKRKHGIQIETTLDYLKILKNNERKMIWKKK